MQLSDSRSYLGINALGSIGRISWSSFGGLSHHGIRSSQVTPKAWRNEVFLVFELASTDQTSSDLWRQRLAAQL